MAASLPSCTADTVRSSPPCTQSPPAHTPGNEVLPFVVDHDSILLQLHDLARCQRADPHRTFCPIALNTTSASSVQVCPVPSSLPVARGARRLEFDAANAPVRNEQFTWCCPGADSDTPCLRELLFVAAGIHVLLAATVDHGYLFRAERLALHCDVDRGHSAADHDHAAADRQRGLVRRLPQRLDVVDRVRDARRSARCRVPGR